MNKDLLFEEQGWIPVKLTPQKLELLAEQLETRLSSEDFDTFFRSLKDESFVLLEKGNALLLTHRNPAKRDKEMFLPTIQLTEEKSIFPNRLIKEFIYYQIFGASLFLTFLYGIWQVIPNTFLAIFVSNTIAFLITKTFINKKKE